MGELNDDLIDADPLPRVEHLVQQHPPAIDVSIYGTVSIRRRIDVSPEFRRFEHAAAHAASAIPR